MTLIYNDRRLVISVFSAIIEKHAPIREMRVSDENSLWVTIELKYLMMSRDRL